MHYSNAACSSCTGPLNSECSACSSNYYLYSTTCSIYCPTGYYKDSSECKECDDACKVLIIIFFFFFEKKN